jgi:sigma-B regulation protein RsbU (phosphoserine phosphatase)
MNNREKHSESLRDDWERRLDLIVDMMRDVSRERDPQQMVRTYGKRIRQLVPADAIVGLSRRDLGFPYYKVTRASIWEREVNPWVERDRLPVYREGLFGELIYGDLPRIIDDLDIDPGDPAAEFLVGQRSVAAIPLYDEGVALNMVILARNQPGAFDRDEFPEMVWVSNLFGRATHNLVLSEELQRAYDIVDHELKVVADIQRSLLPTAIPQIPTLDLAVSYQTSRWAGGDYYDFFQLPDGRWGLLIADVSGHGTPAAVIMAITHGIAHAHPGPPSPPSRMLNFVNHHLATRYTAESGAFVTAFYGVYDPATRSLTYSSAGHNPPRLKRCDRGGAVISLDGAQKMPMGIDHGQSFHEETIQLLPGDQVVFYTDGITEAENPEGKLFGVERLDEVLKCTRGDAEEIVQEVLAAVERFTAGAPPGDDRTLLVARVH